MTLPPPERSPLASFAGFLTLFALSYRLMFPGLADSFLNNGLADVIIFTALLFYVFAALRPTAGRLAVNLPAAALILLALIYILASRLSHYPRASWMENASIAALACLFLAVSGALFTKKDSPRAALFLVALSVVSVSVALLQYLYEFPRMIEKVHTLTPPFLPRDIGVYVSEKNAPDFITRIESLEIFSTFFVSNAFAGFLALSLPVTLGLAVASLAPGRKSAPPLSRRRKIISSSIFALLAALEALLLVLTKSKGGLAASLFALSLFALLLLWRFLPKKTFLIILASALILAAALLALAFPRATQFLDEAKTSLSVRAGYWRATSRIIRENPFEGTGPGNFAPYYFKHLDAGQRQVQNPHNAYLLVWAEAGLFALLTFLAFWLLVFVGPRLPDDPANAPPTPPGPLPAALALFSGAALFIVQLSSSAGLSLSGDLPLALVIAAAALAGAALVFFLYRTADTMDPALIRLALAAGLAGFLLSSAVDLTFSVPSAAAAAIFAAAALSPRRKAAALKPSSARSVALAAVAALALILFVGRIYLPAAQAETAFSAAKSALADRDGIAAAANARIALKLDPQNASIHAFLGRLYAPSAKARGAGSPDFKLAADFFSNALALDPLDLTALEGRADLYASALPTYRQEAIDAHVALVLAFPANSRFHLKAAAFAERIGFPLDAVKHYSKALLLDDLTEQHGIKLSPEERAQILRAIDRLAPPAHTAP